MSTETIVSSPSRRSLIQTAGATGLAIGAGALLAGCGGSDGKNEGSFSNSVHISMSSIATGFKSIQADEDNHVQVLIAGITALGATPRPAPTFGSALVTSPQTSIGTFVALSAALENTGTGAYVSAVPLANLDNSTATLALGSLTYTPLEAAAAIAIVEGRHAGFLNALLGRPLLTNPDAGDTAEPGNYSREVIILPDQVASRAAPFIGTVTNGIPADVNLNGGPPLQTNATIGSASLADIFNFALFLEYLESTFYNANVPHFFP